MTDEHEFSEKELNAILNRLGKGKAPELVFHMIRHAVAHGIGVVVFLLLGSLADRARIVDPVCRDGGHPIIDLVQEFGYPCTVGSTAVGQVGSEDFAGVCVDRQVEFPPNPSFRRLPKVSNVNPETCGIDEQVDRTICLKLAEADGTELLQSPGQCRVVGDREIDLV